MLARLSARWRGLLALLAVFFGIAVAAAGPASAHAILESSNPSNAATLKTAPTSIEFDFSESVSVGLGFVRVVNDKGDRVDTGTITNVSGDASKISIGLTPGLPDCGYIASYRVISADSHPVAGAISFAVGTGKVPSIAGGESNDAGAADQDGFVSAAYPVMRWVDYGGLIVLTGVFAFMVVSWPAGRATPRTRRVLWWGWGATLVATVLSALLQGVYGAGQGIGSLLTPSIVDATLHTNLGRLFSIRLMLLGLLGIVLWLWASRRVVSRWLEYAGIALLLGATFTFSAGGHSAAGSWVPLAIASDVVHLAAVGVWVGGILAALVVAIPLAEEDELTAVMARFSKIALISVVVILVTGTYQALRLVSSLGALAGTTYGFVLSAKVVGFVALVGLGYASRGWVKARLARSEDVPVRQELRHTIVVEAGVAAVVIALAAVLVSTPPADEVYSQPVNATVTLANGGSAQLTVDPAKTGSNQLHIYVFGKNGELVDPQSVTITATQKAKQIGPLDFSLTHAGTGHWIGSSAALPIGGAWTFALTVTFSEFDKYVAETTAQIK